MPYISAYDDVKINRRRKAQPNGHCSWATEFIVSPEGDDAPQAYMSESTPGRVIGTHFHEVDQFQVVVHGSGTLGRHRLVPYGVHFARAYTPYGPLVSGDNGLGFITLRVHKDVGGGQPLPAARAKLANIVGREPWQVSEIPPFGEHPGSNILQLSKVKDDRGLAAFSVTLKPGEAMSAPDASHTEGQYVIVTRGSMVHEYKEYRALSIALVRPVEAPMRLVAGADGLDALILNYPQLTPASLAVRG